MRKRCASPRCSSASPTLASRHGFGAPASIATFADRARGYGHEFNYASASEPRHSSSSQYIDQSSAEEDTLRGQKIYAGSSADWVESWQTVAKAVRAHAPAVKLVCRRRQERCADVRQFWCANAGSEQQIAAFWPSDESTVDIIGVDYYPRDAQGSATDYRWMHDRWATADRPMVFGETGLATDDMAAKQALLRRFTSADVGRAMPH